MCVQVLKESLFLYLVILAAGAKTKDEQVSMRVCGCKMLPIWTTFAVKQGSVPLALDLATQKASEREIGAHCKSLYHTTRQPQQLHGMEKVWGVGDVMILDCDRS